MAGADELFTLLIPGHETAEIRTAPGKRRHTVVGPEDENFLAAEIHRHCLSKGNARFGADQDGLGFLLAPRRQEKLKEPEAERADTEEDSESHDGLTQKAAPS
jgi:hypothetical protein